MQLVPKTAQTSRKDVVIKGFLDGTGAIDVVFAGRRRAEADTVLAMLKALWSRANASAPPGRPPEIDAVRLPVQVEGVWRPRFKRDDQGWQTRDHQLYAARGLMVNDDGEAMVFGERPIHQ